MSKTRCYICSSDAGIKKNLFVEHIKCVRCGDFDIDRDTIVDHIVGKLTNPLDISKISGWIKENQQQKIDNIKFEWLVNNLSMPNVYEKGQKLLKWLNQKSKYPGNNVEVMLNNENSDYNELLAICWAQNAD